MNGCARLLGTKSATRRKPSGPPRNTQAAPNTATAIAATAASARPRALRSPPAGHHASAASGSEVSASLSFMAPASTAPAAMTPRRGGTATSSASPAAVASAPGTSTHTCEQ